MNKIQRSIAAMALALTLLSGLLLPAIGLAALANTAISHHASSVSTLSLVGKTVAKPEWPCGPETDC